MVSISVPGMDGWGNSPSQLRGVLGLSPSHRSGLGAPFFMAKPRRDTPPLVNQDNAPKTARGTNDQGSAGHGR